MRTLTSHEVRLARASARALEANLLRGCGDNSCRFRCGPVTGMGTNGGCMCRDRIQDALEAYARSLPTPCPECDLSDPVCGHDASPEPEVTNGE